MILFDDAAGERKTKSPASFFSCESWLKDFVEVLFADAFAVIRDINDHFFIIFMNSYRDDPLSFQRIEGIL